MRLESDLDRQLSALMARAQDGDRAAYAALLRETAGLVRAFVGRRVHHVADVEDIVQETLLSVHRYRHTYDPARPFAPWMYAIARHRLLDAVRKQRQRSRHEVLVGAGSPALCPAPTSNSGVTNLVQDLLGRLSRAQGDIVRMLKLEGYSVAEIARRTGRSESAVKVTAHRGYNHLRKLIVSEADEE